MSEQSGLIWAYDVAPDGSARELGWAELDGALGDGFRWIHLQLDAADARHWLRERSGLGELAVDALLAIETRPRSLPAGPDQLLLILRGVNLNPGADPEDMVSVRLWADARRVITVRIRRLLSLQDLRERTATGRGPRSPGEFVAELADGLVDRMAGVLAELEERLDAMEELADPAESVERHELLELRRQAILLRRYLSPQRDALARLPGERIAWLGERERLQLREVGDRTTRYVEDLEAARERAAVIQEELASALAEQMNRRMYALSIIAGVFLPLGFATGLLGINVAGIPGTETPWAFGVVCAALILLALAQLVVFRRLRWL